MVMVVEAVLLEVRKAVVEAVVLMVVMNGGSLIGG